MPYKEFERAHYAFVSEKMLTDPVRALINIATEDCLHDDREHLFDFMHGAICSSMFNDYDEEQMSMYMHFIERMFWMLEASHRTAELHKKEQLNYSYVGETSPK